jgi:hypothetical protein
MLDAAGKYVSSVLARMNLKWALGITSCRDNVGGSSICHATFCFIPYLEASTNQLVRKF